MAILGERYFSPRNTTGRLLLPVLCLLRFLEGNQPHPSATHETHTLQNRGRLRTIILTFGNFSLVSFNTSNPLRPGIVRSNRTTSGSSFSISSRACCPSPASPTTSTRSIRSRTHDIPGANFKHDSLLVLLEYFSTTSPANGDGYGRRRVTFPSGEGGRLHGQLSSTRRNTCRS